LISLSTYALRISKKASKNTRINVFPGPFYKDITLPSDINKFVHVETLTTAQSKNTDTKVLNSVMRN